MPRETTDNLELKDYLLGSIDTGAQEKIEERLMTDDEFFEELLAVEEDLIQDYVDEDLTPDEAARFETHFLINEERREKLEFARTLRRNIEAQSTEENVRETTPEKPLNFFQRIFASPIPATAGLLIIFGLSALLIWNFFLRSNDADTALASLNKAYQTERPLESRISQFDYAPLKNTRGGDDSKIDPLQLDIAKTESLKPASENPTAENLHAAGRFYLTQKEFDNAIAQLEKAERLNADNAQIQNDLGVAFLEKGRLVDKDEGLRLELFAKALDKFEKSIEKQPQSSEAVFNRAMTLQEYLPRQAKKAWENYLEIDSSSEWADEARQNLQKLNRQTEKNLSADELFQKFLAVSEKKEDGEAFKLVSQNRELANGKYLPQKIALSLVADLPNREKYLQTLEYLGTLEKEQIQDHLAFDLAAYYREISESNIEDIKKAHAAVKKGYALIPENRFTDVLAELQTARKFLEKADNQIEAFIIIHIISTIFYHTGKGREALQMMNEVDKFTSTGKYRWLNLLNRQWLTANERTLNLTTELDLLQSQQKDLEMAKQIKDSYLSQTILQSMVEISHFLKQQNRVLQYMQQLFFMSRFSEASVRQKARNFLIVPDILTEKQFHSLSKNIVLEGLTFAEDTKDIFFLINYQIKTGMVLTRSESFDKAREVLAEAKKNIEAQPDSGSRNSVLAEIYLNLGHLEKEINNLQFAAANYDKALEFLEGKNPILIYEAQKSRLIAHQEANNDAEVEKQLAGVIKASEQYRSEILSEKARNIFFDSEQTIYDLAVEHELRKGNLEKAFNYAESSSSRSLLDWLNKGASLSLGKEETEVIFNDSSKSMALSSLQEKIAPEVQILQFTVLPEKILVWLISKNEFEVVSINVDVNKLEDDIDYYQDLIQTDIDGDNPERQNLAHQLYNTLIGPLTAKINENKVICIIPNKSLFNLPFASLMDSEDNYLISKYKFFYAPSSNVFVLSTENAKRKSAFKEETLLSVGNPAFDKKEFSDLQDLPSATEEARTISAFYKQNKILAGKDATKEAFQNYLSKFNVIHFAGHYLVKNGVPLSSGLLLAKDEAKDQTAGMLTNAELLNKKFINTKLIVLSACQTGVEGYDRGEGLIGLSRTFLAAGVPLVVGSQWKVDSDATAELMTGFHRFRRTQKVSTTEALRHAQLEMIKSENKRLNSPYYWAAFSVFGGYSNY